MASIVVRPTTPADAESVAQLIRSVFGLPEHHPGLAPEHLHWKFWANRADWPVPRSYVMARGSTLLAHAGAIPGLCLWGPHSLQTFHLIDWVARRDAVGAGSAVMKALSRRADALLAIGGSNDTLAILPRIGFRPVSEALSMVRSLRPWRRLVAPQKINWRLPPRLIRAFAWHATSPRSNAPGWTYAAIPRGETQAFDLPEYPRAPGLAVMARTVDGLQYATTCPAVRTELYAVRGPTPDVRGHFVLGFVRSQVRLADFGLTSTTDADWHALFQLAAECALSDPGAAEIVTVSSDPDAIRRLIACGFHVRGRQPVQVLMPTPPTPGDLPVAVTMLDNDACSRPQMRPEFWA